MYVFCIESSHSRGLGHLYRSLTLASALQKQGHVVRYLVNDHSSSLALIRARGYSAEAVDLQGQDDWEIRWLAAHKDVRTWIDDRLDTTWQHARNVKMAGVSLVTFDDRGPGATLADLNIAALPSDDAHVPQGKKVLQGVRYLLLDAELAQWRRVRESSRRWLISLGGADTWGLTPVAMHALMARGLSATVILGPAFQHGDAVDAVLKRAYDGQFVVHRNGVPSLFEVMFDHDVAITAGGMTPFQATATGLPCFVLAAETFEVPVARQLASMGGCLFGGFRTEVDWSPLDRQQPWTEMSRIGMQSVDLQGCDRICQALQTLSKERA